MNEADKLREITSANREAWEEAAPNHAKHNQESLVKIFSEPGHSCLNEIEMVRLEALDFRGKSVAQVCCNNGREIISVKNMGAGRCVGFDGAKSFLEQARELASAAGQDVEFVCCDIYDIDESYYAAFDIVTITIGVVSWMPDVDRFFAVVANLIKSGGALFIYEQHPILDMVEPAGPDEPLDWNTSYFSKESFVEYGLDYFKGESYDAKPATSFIHRMSEVIMAGVKSGLSLEHFEELPHHISNTWWNIEKADIGLPMSYTLVLRKGCKPEYNNKKRK